MTNFYATTDSVGEWDGQEGLAASQFNVIVAEIIAIAGDDTDKIADAVHYAWDEVGSEESLLTMGADDLKAIARKYA